MTDWQPTKAAVRNDTYEAQLFLVIFQIEPARQVPLRVLLNVRPGDTVGKAMQDYCDDRGFKDWSILEMEQQ